MQDAESVWHREVIAGPIERLLPELVKTRALVSFYLAGGTGLALHLGHRRSVDLDFFSSETFDPHALIRKLRELSGFTVIAKDEETLHAHIEGIRVSFLAYPYPMLFPQESFDEVQVANARDIACMKISAIAGRGTKRDFVDLYSASQLYGLAQLREWFKQKFAQANYSTVHVLKSLTYFEGAEPDPMPDMLVPVAWEEVRKFFTTEVPRLL